ncbi:MAG: tannase/feruloyl esterase family alpha/beta hydrolase [Candidatus Limnocylindrales bacterium]
MHTRRAARPRPRQFSRHVATVLTVSLLVPLLTFGSARPAPTSAASCPNIEMLDVLGAEKQERFCLGDLTTAGLMPDVQTDPRDWAGLHAKDTRNPSGVPGVQINGYFRDDSTSNPQHGWNHDSQFVIRLPSTWNGKLVITGAPGVRRQYANDVVISDWVLARGYAYASTDKGNGGATFFKDGDEPGDAFAEWHRRVTELTIAAKSTVQQHYGVDPVRTYLAGVSNGGYLVRWALENRPELYDGGVDWEGTLFRQDDYTLVSANSGDGEGRRWLVRSA